MDEKTQEERIADYVKAFKTVGTEDEALLKHSIKTAISRVLLYLNHATLDKRFEMIVADVVNGVFMRYAASKDSNEVDSAVSSISDNGQSVHFSNELTNYFTTASDNELLGGVTQLISRYRRPRVVYPKQVQESDS